MAATVRDLIDFVATEARLIDEGSFDAWLSLFAEDGTYWVPLAGATQADPFSHNSLAYEDRLLLALRIERLKNPRAHSLRVATRCQHVLQASSVERHDNATGQYELRTPFVYVETRGERQLMLAGSARHQLTVVDGALKIRQKRVDLLDADAPLPAIQLFP
ncbi:MAG TPA: aromatic-ring-hydroxylating dioxygenase subunit beta [Burkholderiaceae bacterium]|nr:aromatic-ring-hydroxylating dioxygenase subunit beta [Burkholderiaceae bacterium]